jgi:predicted  nucleic acid-binding Zn-ribbon protein
MNTLTIIQSAAIVFLVGLLGALIRFGVVKINEWSKEIKAEIKTLSENMVDVVHEIKEIRKDFDRVNGRFEAHDAELRSVRQRLHSAENTIAAILTMFEILKFQGCKDGKACVLADVMTRFDPVQVKQERE